VAFIADRTTALYAGGRFLERGAQSGYAATEYVRHSRTARIEDKHAGFNGQVRRGDAVTFCFACEGIEEPEEARNANRDDDKVERQKMIS
jgi:hypothetical protein